MVGAAGRGAVDGAKRGVRDKPVQVMLTPMQASRLAGLREAGVVSINDTAFARMAVDAALKRIVEDDARLLLALDQFLGFGELTLEELVRGPSGEERGEARRRV